MGLPGLVTQSFISSNQVWPKSRLHNFCVNHQVVIVVVQMSVQNLLHIYLFFTDTAVLTINATVL